MNTEELEHLADCKQAMKQARWAIALQLGRFGDGNVFVAVKELQEALYGLLLLVGESKPENLQQTPRTNAARVLCNYGQEMVPLSLARELEIEGNLLRNEIEAKLP